MILKIKTLLQRRKAKMFLMFLVCSALIWFINNLSESYISDATFNLEFVNTPDSLLLTKASKNQVDVKIQANGFHFLGFNIKNKTVKIDLSAPKKINNKYFITQNAYRKQIDKQLRSMTLLEIDQDSLFFEFTEINSKIVPVKSRIKVNLSQNYILDSELTIEPNTITIKGPKSTIDTINSVKTLALEFPETTADFTHKVALYKSPDLKNISYSVNMVSVHGKIARFSEKVIKVPIQVINLPKGIQIRTFPDKVAVLCKAKIDDLKNIDSSGFQVVADYNVIKDNSSNIITVELIKQPENVYSASLNEDQIEYLIKRQ